MRIEAGGFLDAPLPFLGLREASRRHGKIRFEILVDSTLGWAPGGKGEEDGGRRRERRRIRRREGGRRAMTATTKGRGE